MNRGFRALSLRWRLTLLYLGLLLVLLTLLGVGQYFAVREVIYRSNATVLATQYRTVATLFRRQHPGRLLPQQFAMQMASAQVAAVVRDKQGIVAEAPATLDETSTSPVLSPQDYMAALQNRARPYYIAPAGDPPRNYLAVLLPIELGGRIVGVAQLSLPTADIDRVLRLDRLLAAGASLIVLLLAAAISPWVVARALRPLGQMSRAALALADGDFKQRVAVPASQDEIGELALAFNRMAAGIDEAFEVRRRSEEHMRHFVADASHELRTPLTALAGYIDVLARRKDVDGPTLQRSLEAMGSESDRMTRLVQDLLTLTRFESGKAGSRQRIEVDAWLERTLDELQLFERGVKEIRDLKSGAAVDGDPEALKRVVLNLAENALKYAPAAEQRWSTFTADGRVAIRLSDSGPGIAASDLPHVFERFYRGEKARDRAAGGSGLGLAIVRSIVEAHQGSIEADSPPGGGAIFTVWLPLKTSAGVA